MLTGFFGIASVNPQTGELLRLDDFTGHHALIELEDSNEVLLLAGGAVRRIDLTTAKESWKRREQGDCAALVESPGGSSPDERR